MCTRIQSRNHAHTTPTNSPAPHAIRTRARPSSRPSSGNGCPLTGTHICAHTPHSRSLYFSPSLLSSPSLPPPPPPPLPSPTLTLALIRTTFLFGVHSVFDWQTLPAGRASVRMGVAMRVSARMSTSEGDGGAVCSHHCPYYCQGWTSVFRWTALAIEYVSRPLSVTAITAIRNGRWPRSLIRGGLRYTSVRPPTDNAHTRP